MASEGSAGGEAAVARVFRVVLLANVALAGLKVSYGLWTGILAIRADGFHSALDAVNNVVAMLVAKLAARPPDADHPYGHRKFEVLGSVAIGVLVLLFVGQLGGSAIQSLLHPNPAQIEPEAFVVMLATFAFNIAITAYEYRRGRSLESPLLVADAKHTLSDVFVTLGVLAGLVGNLLGHARADAFAALAVTGMVGWLAVEIFRQGLPVLSDHVAIPPGEIGLVASGVPGVLRCHSVRSRGASGDVRVDLIVEVDPELTVAAAHAIADRVEEAVQAHWSDVAEVVVHIEPASPPGSP